MRQYEEAELMIVAFESEDVIADSVGEVEF
jgi:hypothetical protein